MNSFIKIGVPFSVLIVAVVLFISQQSVAPVDSMTKAYSSSGYRHIMIGEANHGDPLAWNLTKEVLCNIADTIDFVGFEIVNEDLQRVIDGTDKVSSLRILYGNADAQSEFLEVLELLRLINKERKRGNVKEIKIMGLDKAMPKIDSSLDSLSKGKILADWFMTRDVFMADNLSRLGQRGLIHMRAAHTSKRSIVWPKKIKEQISLLPNQSRPLGYLLNKELPKEGFTQDLGVIVGSHIEIEKYRTFLPESWLALWRFMNSLRSVGSSSDKLFKASNKNFQSMVKKFFTKEYSGPDIINGYDYLVFKGKPRL